MTGTFTGDAKFEGAIATGAKIDITGCDVLTVRDGKIVHNDAYMNGMQMARQLGVLPPQGSGQERAMIGAVNVKTRLARRSAANARPPGPRPTSTGRPRWKPWAMSTPYSRSISRRRVVLDELGDRRLAEAAGDLDDRLDGQLVGVVARHVADEGAVDLDQVEGDLLQVVEGAEAGAVVVDRDLAAELGEAVGEAGGRVVVVDLRRSR